MNKFIKTRGEGMNSVIEQVYERINCQLWKQSSVKITSKVWEQVWEQVLEQEGMR